MDRIDCKKCKHHYIVYGCEDNCELENNGHRCRFEEVGKQTNGDRIRQMSNEEIIAWIGSIDERLCPFSCPPGQTDCNDDCRGCWLEWLNKEVEE